MKKCIIDFEDIENVKAIPTETPTNEEVFQMIEALLQLKTIEL